LRFVSIEPMLGSVDLTRIVLKRSDAPEQGKPDVSINALKGWHGGGLLGPTWLDGVIVGGESGSKGRRLDPLWVCAVRDQCAAFGVPFMFKQWGHENRNEVDPETGFPCLQDGRTYAELAW
jgi:protein gp37